MEDVWIEGIKKASEDMLNEVSCKYRFHLTCGAETYEEEVKCSPSQVRSELRDWVENLITYSAKRINEVD